jgi:hypothetical protein
MMNKLLIFLSVIIINACSGQSRINPVQKFESELTDFALKKFHENSPFSTSESFLAGCSYYASFEILGNSGTNLLYDLKEKDIQILERKLKTYSRLDNDKLKSFEYNFRYSFEDGSILLPDVSDEWNDILGNVDLKNNEIEIYLIQKGKLENAFKQESTNNVKYNFSCGAYFFKKVNKFIYWFTIYNA